GRTRLGRSDTVTVIIEAIAASISGMNVRASPIAGCPCLFRKHVAGSQSAESGDRCGAPGDVPEGLIICNGHAHGTASMGAAAARRKLRFRKGALLLEDGADQKIVLVTQAHPAAGVVARLPLEIGIACMTPQLHFAVEVVEDVVAPVSAHSKDRMTLAVTLAHDGDQEIGERYARVVQPAPLFQHVVFAVADTVYRIGPDLFTAVDIDVAVRLHSAVNRRVDGHDLVPERGCYLERAGVAWPNRAFLRSLLAELVMADRLGGYGAGNH